MNGPRITEGGGPEFVVDYSYEDNRSWAVAELNNDPEAPLILRNIAVNDHAFNIKVLPLETDAGSMEFDPSFLPYLEAGGKMTANVYPRVADISPLFSRRLPYFLRKTYKDTGTEELFGTKVFTLRILYADSNSAYEYETTCELLYRPWKDRITVGKVQRVVRLGNSAPPESLQPEITASSSPQAPARQEDSIGSVPSKKPIDRWLGLAGIAAGALFYLVPRTPAAVVLSLVLLFGLLIHPLWNFWWIEKRLWTRMAASALFLSGLAVLGYVSWPPKTALSLTTNSNSALLPKATASDVAGPPVASEPKKPGATVSKGPCLSPIGFSEVPVQSGLLPYSKRVSIRTLADREMKLRWFWKGNYFAGEFHGDAIDSEHSYMDNTTITMVLKPTGRTEQILLSSDRPLEIECIDQLQ